jgi:CMP-N-acetylneuraminic acid synthetase|tara:strand:- start:350 stop:1009 length:660 start_codon:yes stop_codon:yes gene_type:complete
LEKKTTFFIIPARRDSKGLPFKNRKLLDYTINNIPIELHEKTIVTTNDEKIIEKLSATNINVLRRDEQLCLDDISIKDVMLDVVKKFQMKSNDTIVMLYLTSPDRKFSDIEKILGYYYERKIKTLTCCVEPKTHPYLVLFKKENQKGEQVVKHDLYRRQDYPECFEIRHFVCIFQVDEIQKLNSNMYNESTIFYKIDSDIDVDHENDLKEFLKSNTIKG